MSSSLPPEILDIIVDHSCDEPTTLNACCVVSKSWVPRTRRHLFFRVEFSSKYPIKSWMETFPDPSNSPAHYARVLLLSDLTAADTYARDWVHSFYHINELHIAVPWQESLTHAPLVSLHGLSPTLKSLFIHYSSFSPSGIFSLVCSFPLLEDIHLRLSTKGGTAADEWGAPLTSPKLTGSLDLNGGIRPIARRLLGLPGGLHFSEIKIRCPVGDADLITDLVLKCRDTLESLHVGFPPLNRDPLDTPSQIDLSKVTKLKDLEFELFIPNVRWLIATLETARCKNLRRITIRSYFTFNSVGEARRQEWQELDRLLVQLWTSHSISPQFTFRRARGRFDLGDIVPGLLPELMSRGFVGQLGS